MLQCTSHYYIVISLEQLEETEAIKEDELLPANNAKRDTDLPLYVTASVNDEDFQPTFNIGDGSRSTDPLSQRTFYNAPLQKQQIYYYFIRVYLKAHTTEVSCTFTLGLSQLCFQTANYAFERYSKIKTIMLKVMHKNKKVTSSIIGTYLIVRNVNEFCHFQ